jgi:hypothetical protein
MGVFNRRNALVGWAAWQIGKRVMKQKARNAVPGTVEGSRKPNLSAILLGVAAVAGALAFWWKRGSGDDDLDSPPG